MNDFSQRMKMALIRMMQGRYGFDSLSKAMFVIAIITMAVGAFVPKVGFLSTVSLALMLWTCFRCYSRNIPARYAENMWYLRMTEKIRGKKNIRHQKHEDRKTHAYFKCPQCGKMLRVPKGKGKIRITCPQCSNVIEKRT